MTGEQTEYLLMMIIIQKHWKINHQPQAQSIWSVDMWVL
jgi:hypothetical protein